MIACCGATLSLVMHGDAILGDREPALTAPQLRRSSCTTDRSQDVSHVQRSHRERRHHRGQRLHHPRHPALRAGGREFHRLAGHRWSSRRSITRRARDARLVILDYKMPKLDGFAACAQIRRLPGYADMPIVILTAFDDDETRASGTARRRDCVPCQAIQAGRSAARHCRSAGAFRSRHGSAAAAIEPVAFVWKRRQEPPPLYRRAD